MLSFILMLLNGWAAFSIAGNIAALKAQGQAVKWWLHALGAANVFFCIVNAIIFFAGT